MSTKHFNIFNTGESSFFTPGVQLANIARVKPDAPAIVYINPENKESVMTWHSLDVLSNRIAWYLLEQGIKPGKSVIVALPNIPTHIALAFGIWKAGGCYVPISPRVPRKNMIEICECVSPSLVISKGIGFMLAPLENMKVYSDGFQPDGDGATIVAIGSKAIFKISGSEILPFCQRSSANRYRQETAFCNKKTGSRGP